MQPIRIQLRDYQENMISGVRQVLRQRVRRVLLQAPTGAGKTILAAYMIGGAAARSEDSWFICHRAELVEGTSNTFRKFGIHHGMIAAGFPMMLRQLVQICSIDTLKNRLDSLKAPRLAVIDECHHCAAAGWALVIEWLHANGTIIIGLSATPIRLDGQGLDAHFDELVLGPEPSWLIENGHLAQYKIYAPGAPDMTGVKRQLGDYAKGETARRMAKAKLTGDAIGHWTRLAKGMRTVAFAVNVEHSLHIVQLFNAAGIRAAHLDGNTPKQERRNIIQAYAAGALDVLSNVSLFGEGFDLSAIAQTDTTIDCVVDMAPTMSLSSYLQRGGRMLRPSPGKTGIYLDHAGNSGRHGFFDDLREWSLDGKDKDGKAREYQGTPPATCEGCLQQIRHPLPEFCSCGKRLKREVKEIQVADGELREQTEADKRQVRARLKAEQAQAKTLDELVALGKQRGHKYPQKWALHVFSSRPRPASESNSLDVADAPFDPNNF